MITPGPVTVLSLSGSCRFQPELRRGDIALVLLSEGSYRLECGFLWDRLTSPLVLISSGMHPFVLQGKGEAAAVTVSSRLIDSLLQTSYGRRLSPFVQTVRDGGTPVYRPGAKDLAGLENLLGKIGEEMDYRESEWEQVVQLHLLELFLMLGRLSSLSEREKASFENISCVWTMADVTEYLKNHYDDSFTLDDLASRCALNASYFSRTFKSHAGVPLFEYINRLRIERACGLLRDTESSVLDIALAVGYNNVSFFNRYFRRLMQMSPGEYRKRIRR